jgi:hypothetical protein
MKSTSSDSNLHNSHIPSVRNMQFNSSELHYLTFLQVTYHSYFTNNRNQHQFSFAVPSVLIPQRPYRSNNTSESYRAYEPNHVEFFMDDGTLGFPVKDALNRNYTHLRNRDDKCVLGQCSSVSIRIEVSSFSCTVVARY